jgi:Tfp pilus assembly protein PilO
MRLKVFFTPLAFLIAIVVSIWYIWPAVTEIMAKTSEVNTSKKNLESAISRKENSEVLKGVLDKNKDKEDFILSYFPFSGNNEKIIDGINYLAADSGLSLISFDIEEEKADNPFAQGNSDLSGANNSVASGSPANGEIQAVKPKIKFSNAKITLSGKYENIKMFLDQIYKMEMLNTIDSLIIAKSSGAETAENQGSSNEVLSVDVEIKFGHMPQIKERGDMLSEVFSKNNFNFSSYSKINELIAKKIPVLDEGQKGKSNPFVN